VGKRVIVGLLGAAALLGMKFYNKSADHTAVKARLVELCKGDSRCLQSVETNFEACFEQSYKMGGRRKAAQLDTDQFTSCLNSRSGRAYFSASK
jgi:hypothetical protein